MSTWTQWLRDFVKTWFSSLLEGLIDLDSENRAKILKKTTQASPSTPALEEFRQAWETENFVEIGMGLHTALDKIKNCNEPVQTYLQQWFAGFMEGMESLDDETKKSVLGPCGRACAEFGTKRFERAWKESTNLKAFVDNLNELLGKGAEIFKLEKRNLITLTVPKCSCPLVEAKFIDSPILCIYCGCVWLQTNFSAVMQEKRIEVKPVETILLGANECRFNVKMT